jgi:hypothetical protein
MLKIKIILFTFFTLQFVAISQTLIGYKAEITKTAKSNMQSKLGDLPENINLSGTLIGYKAERHKHSLGCDFNIKGVNQINTVNVWQNNLNTKYFIQSDNYLWYLLLGRPKKYINYVQIIN